MKERILHHHHRHRHPLVLVLIHLPHYFSLTASLTPFQIGSALLPLLHSLPHLHHPRDWNILNVESQVANKAINEQSCEKQTI